MLAIDNRTKSFNLVSHRHMPCRYIRRYNFNPHSVWMWHVPSMPDILIKICFSPQPSHYTTSQQLVVFFPNDFLIRSLLSLSRSQILENILYIVMIFVTFSHCQTVVCHTRRTTTHDDCTKDQMPNTIHVPKPKYGTNIDTPHSQMCVSVCLNACVCNASMVRVPVSAHAEQRGGNCNPGKEEINSVLLW